MRIAGAVCLFLASCGDEEGGDDAAAYDGGRLDAGFDAVPSSCGLAAPGSRCVGRVLERCNGPDVERVDCAAEGALCGPDPGGSSGRSCIKRGDACGAITFQGACADSVLAYCSRATQTLQIADCAEAWSICAWTGEDIGYDCTTECALAGVGVEGSCEGAAAIRRCSFRDGAYKVETLSCPPMTTCQIVADTGWPGCLPVTACVGVGPGGHCAGNILTRCMGGEPREEDCAEVGKVCAYGGNDEGYVCASAGAVGPLAASGVVRYEDRASRPSGLGTRRPEAARGVTVAVVGDGAGDVLAAAVTGDDGSYMLRYTAAAGAQVHLLVATSSSLAMRPLRVIRPDGLVHGMSGPSFSAAAASTQDLLVTDVSGLAPAFNIFDQLVSGLDFATAASGIVPQPVFAQWIRGSVDGTYYSPDLNGIFLLGMAADDDGYDDTVILHELGHYVEDVMGRSDSPGGYHDGSPTDPRLAWSEGFATYFAMAVSGEPLYVDTNAAGIGVLFDGESTVTPAPMPSGDMLQNVSEDMVTEILWDAGDAPGTDDDDLTAASHDQVMSVEGGYIHGLSGSRGVAGVDLVDWLDGWFATYDLTWCAGLRAIVAATRQFPYDFAGPGGTCPED